MRSAGYHEKMIGRTYFGSDQVTQLNFVLYNTINWPYQPKHSPSSTGVWFSGKIIFCDNLLRNVDVYLKCVVVTWQCRMMMTWSCNP